ncbi:hypothetical protein D3C71_2088540 [compost metagenome]
MQATQRCDLHSETIDQTGSRYSDRSIDAGTALIHVHGMANLRADFLEVFDGVARLLKNERNVCTFAAES